MENQGETSGRRHREQSSPTSSSSRRSLKRKLDEEFDGDSGIAGDQSPQDSHQDLVREVRAQVEILESAFSYAEKDRLAAKNAINVLSDLARNEDMVNVIVDCAAVPTLVRHLQAPPLVREGDTGPRPYEHEVEKGSAFTLGLLAIKPEHQQLIVDAGALPYLVDLLKRHRDGLNSRAVSSVIRRAADAITNLAHENSSIKTRVRVDGGIPPLVELLEFADPKVQRAAAGALRTLAFKNDDNKNQIVECNALPTLILMLRSEDAAIHYEALLLFESQREAALLLGQFAATDSDCKVHIVQRGALRPLLEMLQSPDTQLKEMSAFALGRLAQDTHNQAGIAHSGAIVPLLKLLESKMDFCNIMLHLFYMGLQTMKLANKASSLSPMDAAPPSPIPQVYLGEQFVNNPTLSDVTFLVEGKRFYAHRICLLASSDAFRLCLTVVTGYIYTGSVDVNLDIAQDLLRAADQYLLEGLKRLCEYAIAQDISVENVSLMFELSEAYNALSLRHACVLFILEKFDKLCIMPWYVLPSVVTDWATRLYGMQVFPADPTYFARDS
ncbi:hypothetical protein DH2020_024845 [Rehmannia glutinosa]|uniref:BTB domain-containing protein n=1 Tax=Rehmannia glutinosa TaxID=99300 RepID=A0ABR0W251_REHGL